MPFRSGRPSGARGARYAGACAVAGVTTSNRPAAATAAAFGPPLGLTGREAPRSLDAAGCPAFEIIGRELAGHGGEMEARELVWTLGRHHGLNRDLSTLYMLAFVHHSRAELGLTEGHSVRFRHGGPESGQSRSA